MTCVPSLARPAPMADITNQSLLFLISSDAASEYTAPQCWVAPIPEQIRVGCERKPICYFSLNLSVIHFTERLQIIPVNEEQPRRRQTQKTGETLQPTSQARFPLKCPSLPLLFLQRPRKRGRSECGLCSQGHLGPGAGSITPPVCGSDTSSGLSPTCLPVKWV